MCLALPGKIVSIKDNTATIQYPGEKRTAKILDGEYSVGDYVYVTAQIVIQKLPEKDAQNMLRAWKNAT
jgi:hydrogenase assembly chaperone HypC/HupF